MQAGNKTILLVEDNQDDELLTLMAFRENKVANNVHVVRDGAEALDYLFGKGKYAGRDLTDLPTIILLDLNLPRLHGLEVLRQIRANDQTKLLPVVILTTSSEEKDLVNSYRLGCNSYIQKPVDMTQFVSALKDLGVYWLVLNKCAPLPPTTEGT